MSRLLIMFYSTNVMVLTVLIARFFERRWPAVKTSDAEVIADWKATGANMLVAWTIEPAALMCGAIIVNQLGGGLIRLSPHGMGYVASLLIFAISFDFYKYWLHRLQHAIPALWAMHSFHHSADALTFITGGRHYWLERTLMVALLPVFPILFHVPTDMAASLALIVFVPEVCAHMNLRLSLGRWLNSPQWHRIHHSSCSEHQDKNFAGLLPLWDILFGTAWIPQRDEYPATGLVPSEKVGIVKSIVWPFRRYLPGTAS